MRLETPLWNRPISSSPACRLASRWSIWCWSTCRSARGTSRSIAIGTRSGATSRAWCKGWWSVPWQEESNPTRWAPTIKKWNYNPYKWPSMCISVRYTYLKHVNNLMTLIEPPHESQTGETSRTCWVGMANFQADMSKRTLEKIQSPFKEKQQ